jgi:hypothetical protein
MAVTLTAGTRFRCQNPDCGCEVEVTNSLSEAESKPSCCCCGSAMKRPYQKPVLKRLDVESKELAHLFEVDASAQQGGPRISLWQ